MVNSKLAELVNDDANKVSSFHFDAQFDNQSKNNISSSKKHTKSKKSRQEKVQVPKTNRRGDIKTNRKGEVKYKTRIKKFSKNGEELFDVYGAQKFGLPRGKKALIAILAILLSALIIAGILITRFLSRVETNLNGGVVTGSISDVLTKSVPLKADKWGRTNIVIFGTSEDDDGHGGASLADTIMVLSIDQATGGANTISIPRDLSYYDKEVAKSSIGCDQGSRWKINAAYDCGTQINNGDERQGSLHMAKVISDVLGIDIQYYVKAKWGALIGIVNAIGGIDVVPYTDSPYGLYDVNQSLILGTGQVHLDGDGALRLSRARNSDGGYGLSRSNFDRELNQQRVVQAIRDKATSSGVLFDPQHIMDITEIIGTNVLTNIYTYEIRSLAAALGKMTKAVSVPLQGPNDAGEEINLVINGVSTYAPGLGSVVLPAEGEYEYENIHEYIAGILSGKKPKEPSNSTTPPSTSTDESDPATSQ
ncbi:MAG: LCP family protein [Candidatus Ancillula sp.]|jgi:LCP family protein required for cell wall assembly|nr:LCP family protein [Candidatus Ancillula sp.]